MEGEGDGGMVPLDVFDGVVANGVSVGWVLE